jgi:hypothetical protein
MNNEWLIVTNRHLIKNCKTGATAITGEFTMIEYDAYNETVEEKQQKDDAGHEAYGRSTGVKEAKVEE